MTAEPDDDASPRDSLRTWVDAEPDALAGLRRRLDQWLGARGVRADRRDGIVLAADEAIANAMEHGAPTNRIETEIERTADTIILTVRSPGTWKRPDADAGRTHGWGLHLIKACADRLHVRHGGDAVILIAEFEHRREPDSQPTG